MKNNKSHIFYALFLISIVSCEKEADKTQNNSSSNNTSSPPTTTNIFIGRYEPIGSNPQNFVVNTLCGTNSGNTNWCCNANNAEIFEQNGQFWIDSLNYIFKEPLPITMLSSSFNFNNYSAVLNQYLITNGSGYLLNDTLTLNYSGTFISWNCTQGTFYVNGKYKKIP